MPFEISHRLAQIAVRFSLPGTQLLIAPGVQRLQMNQGMFEVIVTSLLVGVLMIGAVCVVGPDMLVALERKAGLAWRKLDQFCKTAPSVSVAKRVDERNVVHLVTAQGIAHQDRRPQGGGTPSQDLFHPFTRMSHIGLKQHDASGWAHQFE